MGVVRSGRRGIATAVRQNHASTGLPVPVGSRTCIAAGWLGNRLVGPILNDSGDPLDQLMQQLPQLSFDPLLNLLLPRLHYLLVPLVALGLSVGITFSVIAARERWNAIWVAAVGFTVAIGGASYLL